MTTNWVEVSKTKLVTECGLDHRWVGRLAKAAGFKTKKAVVPSKAGPRGLVEATINDFTVKQVYELAGIPPKWESDATIEYRDDPPQYIEILECLEKLHKLVLEIIEENRQLRAYQPANGISDRAKKALLGAKRTLEIYGG